MGEKPHPPKELYEQRVNRFDAEVGRLGARSRLVSNLRGLTFGVTVIATLFAAFGGAPIPAVLVAGVAAALFAVLLVLHARVLAAEDEAARWAQVNRDALARCTDRWQHLPEDGASLRDSAHPYADDLDLFGPASLFQRLCVAHTRFGQRALARYLTEPASLEDLRARQAATRVLAPEFEMRQRLEALALALVARPAVGHGSSTEKAVDTPQSRGAAAVPAPPDPEPLLHWAESKPLLLERTGVVWLAWSLPVVTLTAAVAASLGATPEWLFVIPLLVQVALNASTRDASMRVFTAVSTTEGAFLRYGAMLEVLEQLDLDSELMASLRGRLLAGDLRPSRSMKEFRNGVGWFDLKHNGLVHPFANALLLWDIHCVLKLERWQRTAGRAARGWFDVLGEFEALSSLAALAHDEPTYAFPEVVDGPTCFEATALGHPLLASGARVANDVALSGPGSVLLVTGSNMSGKSTLLRAMGLGAVMAMAGGPVCARTARLVRCAVRTSVRVSDSLERGVSHFYAELGKLKAVLEATGGELPVLFLLDEILHGTNSRERQIGARWLLSELIHRGAIGAASTHDMGLTRLPEELSDRVELVHFRESVDAGKMTFDYLLRPGPVLAGNALRLMRSVGLDVPLE